MSSNAFRGLMAAGLMVLVGCNATSAPALTPAPTEVPSTPTPAPTPIAPTIQATVAPTKTQSNATVATDFAPKQRSVWNTTIGQDVMTGDCTKGSVLPAYGLVQITPAETGARDSLEWKNQEPKPYAMARAAANSYVYAGPNSINDGVVTMTVTFVDDNNLKMLRQFTSKNDPTCTHTHEYTGVFQWFR